MGIFFSKIEQAGDMPIVKSKTKMKSHPHVFFNRIVYFDNYFQLTLSKETPFSSEDVAILLSSSVYRINSIISTAAYI